MCFCCCFFSTFDFSSNLLFFFLNEFYAPTKKQPNEKYFLHQHVYIACDCSRCLTPSTYNQISNSDRFVFSLSLSLFNFAMLHRFTNFNSFFPPAFSCFFFLSFAFSLFLLLKNLLNFKTLKIIPNCFQHYSTMRCRIFSYVNIHVKIETILNEIKWLAIST